MVSPKVKRVAKVVLQFGVRILLSPMLLINQDVVSSSYSVNKGWTFLCFVIYDKQMLTKLPFAMTNIVNYGKLIADSLTVQTGESSNLREYSI